MPEWENNLAQFTLMLVVMEQAGLFTQAVKAEIMDRMDITEIELDELIARAVEGAENIERRM